MQIPFWFHVLIRELSTPEGCQHWEKTSLWPQLKSCTSPTWLYAPEIPWVIWDLQVERWSRALVNAEGRNTAQELALRSKTGHSCLAMLLLLRKRSLAWGWTLLEWSLCGRIQQSTTVANIWHSKSRLFSRKANQVPRDYWSDRSKLILGSGW